MRVLSITLALLLSTTLAWAQPGCENDQASRRAKHEAFRSYAEANIIPVIAPLREAFDAQLSEEEQAILAEAREALAAQREARRANRPERPQEGERPTEAQREAFREAHRQHRAEMEAIMDPVHDIAAVHAVELRNIMKELRPQAQTWREELHEMFRPEGEAGPERRGEGHHGRPGHHGRHGHHNPLRHMTSPVGFLLWDGDLPLGPASADMEMGLYPNPASGETTIQYELRTAGEVEVNLLDAKGQYIRSLDSGYQEAGSQLQQVDVSGLQPGIYLIQVRSADGESIQKLRVE